jgi:hypothetical protein
MPGVLRDGRGKRQGMRERGHDCISAEMGWRLGYRENDAGV